MNKDTSAETIEVTVNLPPDGSYPSRLLTVGSSIWLPEGKCKEVLPGIFAICERRRCFLFQNEYGQDNGPFINGQPLLERFELQDGDFIQIKKRKFVFQADAVADNRKSWERWVSKGSSQTKSIVLSGKLGHVVVINQDGLLLNSGQNNIPWSELLSVAIAHDPRGAPFQISIHHDEDNRGDKPIIYDLGNFNPTEAGSFYDWLLYSSPIEISCFSFPRTLFDAYFACVQNKIIVPAERGDRLFPAPKEFILDAPTVTQTRLRVLLVLLMVVLPFGICGWFTSFEGKLWNLGVFGYGTILMLSSFQVLVGWSEARYSIAHARKLEWLFVAIVAPLFFFGLIAQVQDLTLSYLPAFYVLDLFFLSIIGAAYLLENRRSKYKPQ